MLLQSQPYRLVAHQVPLSMGFSRQEYWCGWLCPPPGDLLNPGTELTSLMSPALTSKFFTTSTTWAAHFTPYQNAYFIIIFIFKITFDVGHFLSVYWICYNIASVLCFWFFGHEACGILAPWAGIRPASAYVGRLSLNHWTTRKSSADSSLDPHFVFAPLVCLPLLIRALVLLH